MSSLSCPKDSDRVTCFGRKSQNAALASLELSVINKKTRDRCLLAGSRPASHGCRVALCRFALPQPPANHAFSLPKRNTPPHLLIVPQCLIPATLAHCLRISHASVNSPCPCIKTLVFSCSSVSVNLITSPARKPWKVRGVLFPPQ